MKGLKLGIITYLDLLVDQGEKLFKNPENFSIIHIRTIITGWHYLPKEYKIEPEYVENYKLCKSIFEKNKLKELAMYWH